MDLRPAIVVTPSMSKRFFTAKGYAGQRPWLASCAHLRVYGIGCRKGALAQHGR
jgi:hypothetical protein